MDNFLSSFLADDNSTVEVEITSNGNVAIFHLFKDISVAKQGGVQDSLIKVKIVDGKPVLQEDIHLSDTTLPTLKSGIKGVQGIINPALDHADPTNRTPMVVLTDAQLSQLKGDIGAKLLTAINETQGVNTDLNPFASESQAPSEVSVPGPQN